MTLIFFWANWCGYCRQMYPGINALTEKYASRPFAVVGVNCDEDRDSGRLAVGKHKLTFPSWWNGGTAEGRVSDTWLVEAYPTLYLLDETGVIRHKWEGMEDAETIERAVLALLKKAEKPKK